MPAKTPTFKEALAKFEDALTAEERGIPRTQETAQYLGLLRQLQVQVPRVGSLLDIIEINQKNQKEG